MAQARPKFESIMSFQFCQELYVQMNIGGDGFIK